MNFKIEPYDGGYRVICNGWGIGVTLATYDGACAVVNALDKHAKQREGMTVIDYSECVR